MESARSLAIPVEWFELEANVGDRTGGDGKVVLIPPEGAVCEKDGPVERLPYATNGFACHEGARDAARQGRYGDERRRVAPSVVLGEKAVHDSRTEEKAIVNGSTRLGGHAQDIALRPLQVCRRAIRN